MYWAFFALIPLAHSTVIGEHKRSRRQNGPVVPGIISDCTFFYDAKTGDSCASIANDWGISTDQFATYNPSVKSDCTGLVIGASYCVEENFGKGPAVQSTTSTTLQTASLTSKSNTPRTATSTTSAGPSPTQSGISSKCTNYHKVLSGDTCAGIVNTLHTFTLQDFYSWNPAIGITLIKNHRLRNPFAGYYVCVGVPGTQTAALSVKSNATSATSSGPSPTQTGIVTDCVKYYQAVSGDTCNVIADKFGTFSVDDFKIWNPAVKVDCSQLFLGYYYCIGVPNTSTTRSSTTATTSPTAAGPSPTQSGIISSCTKYYQVASGDTCQVVANRFNAFSLADFVTWNPAVKSGCSLLFFGYYYCIAVPGTPTSRLSTPSPSPNTISTPQGPQPQQSGIVSNCNKYCSVKSGDGCYAIEQSQGISSQSFFQWNKGVKSDCSNLFLGYYVCIGVS